MASSVIKMRTKLIRRDYTLSYIDNETLGVQNITIPSNCNLYNCFIVPLSYTELAVKIRGIYKVPDSPRGLFALPSYGKTFSSGDSLTITVIFIPLSLVIAD